MLSNLCHLQLAMYTLWRGSRECCVFCDEAPMDAIIIVDGIGMLWEVMVMMVTPVSCTPSTYCSMLIN